MKELEGCCLNNMYKYNLTISEVIFIFVNKYLKYRQFIVNVI